MPINRRQLLLASAILPTLPFLPACATDISKYRDSPVATLASSLGVCATYATLKSGKPAPAIALSGCGNGPATPVDAVFQAASLTKPVVAFAALRLALAGGLDPDSPVSRYLPSGYTHFHSVLARAPSDPSDPVSASVLANIPVTALLNHTSGLPNWVNGKLAFDFKTGERFGYSGEGYVLLQSVLEAITGMSLAAYFDAQVFTPLGMRSTSLVWKEAFAARYQAASSATGPVRQVRFRAPVAAASLYTTAADYAKFMAAFLVDERLIALALSKPVLVDSELGLDWGQGWGIERAEGGPYFWQWGNNPGVRAFAMASSTSKDGFVMLSNSDQGMALAVPLAYTTLPSEHKVFRFSKVG